MDEKARLREHDLVAGYDSNVVRKGVGLHVEQGEIVTLVGANGSGKSTMINTINGFLRPSGGTTELDRKPIQGPSPHQSFALGVVQISQTRDLFGDLTVEENLRLGAIVRGDASLRSYLENGARHAA